MADTDVQTFEFQREHDGSLSLEAAVFQALGAASVCWETPEGAGVFESTRAKEIGDALIAFIRAQDVDGERARRQVQFLEILADGGDLTVNGVPWREMFERLNSIVADPV